MKYLKWRQSDLAYRQKAVQTKCSTECPGNPNGGLDVRETLPPPVEAKKCLLTSPSIGLSHSFDDYGHMNRIKNLNRTFHLLQKADILTCYGHQV